MNQCRVFSIVLLSYGAIFANLANAADEPLKSKAIKGEACELLSELYPPYFGDWYDVDRELSTFGIEINSEVCTKMDAVVTDKRTKKVGSKNYVVGLDLQFSNEDVNCKLEAMRTVSVTLDNNDHPVVNTGEWQVSEGRDQACYVNAAPELLNVDLDQANNGLKKIKSDTLSHKMHIPDYLELGEPDDGAVGTDFYAYVLKKGSTTLGYVLDYWYANSEGEWATRYILKYNSKGIFLGNLIEKEGYDYCDYPFFEEKPEHCGE